MVRHILVRYFDIDNAMPAAVRRPMRWQMAGLLMAAASFLVLLTLAQLGIVSGLVAASFPLVCIFVVLWGHYFDRAVRQRVARAAAHDHLLCPECLYDLRTLDDAGTCPECGRAYEHAAVRAQWAEAERRLKPEKTGRTIDEPPA